MCFSALASFSVSSLLIPMGLYYSYRVRESQQEQYLPLTLIPVLFGSQQALEGMVWLAFKAHNNPYLNFYALGFLFFFHFLWLFWLAIAALELESRKVYKYIFSILAICGLAFGSFLYFPLLIHPNWLTVSVVQGSIHYEIQVLGNQPWGPALYAVICLLPLRLSSYKYLQRLGSLIFLSLIITKLLFNYAFILVWCFFAALISTYLIYGLNEENVTQISSL